MEEVVVAGLAGLGALEVEVLELGALDHHCAVFEVEREVLPAALGYIQYQGRLAILADIDLERDIRKILNTQSRPHHQDQFPILHQAPHLHHQLSQSAPTPELNNPILALVRVDGGREGIRLAGVEHLDCELGGFVLGDVEVHLLPVGEARGGQAWGSELDWVACQVADGQVGDLHAVGQAGFIPDHPP